MMATHKKHDDPAPDVDWDTFGFGLNGVETDFMWLDRITMQPGDTTVEYSTDALQPMGTIPLSPAATVLNYGQALFEGLKAFRRADDGQIVVVRPERNALRMQQGAERFMLPPVPTDVFLEAVTQTVRANARWVPPANRGALYLRPLLMGTGAGLGVKTSTEVTFCIFGSPVGNYFKGDLRAIRLQAVRGFSRAAPGGSGAVKASGNYAPAFLVQQQARDRGYDEVLCLDAVTGEAVEEAGASNFFAIFKDKLVTPGLDSATILPGVTRSSILELAEKELGMKVEERRLTLAELRSADEAFCCGTGAVITPVGCIGRYDGDQDDDGNPTDDIILGDGETGEVTRTLFNMLIGIQTGTNKEVAVKYKHWIHVVQP